MLGEKTLERICDVIGVDLDEFDIAEQESKVSFYDELEFIKVMKGIKRDMYFRNRVVQMIPEKIILKDCIYNDGYWKNIEIEILFQGEKAKVTQKVVGIKSLNFLGNIVEVSTTHVADVCKSEVV